MEQYAAMLTEEQREAARQMRREEVGTEPACPFCGRARVKRSDYIRCNPCGVNWLLSEIEMTYKGKPYLDVDPRLARVEAARMVNTARPTAEPKAESAE